MILLLIIAWYVLTLALLGVVMGFSPTLYAMTARFAAIHDSRHGASLVRAIIAGVVAAVVSLFLLGGSVALAVQQVWRVFGYSELSRYLLVAVIGVVFLTYARDRLRQPAKGHTKSRATKTVGKLYVKQLGMFLFAFSKTVGSASGLWAAFVVSTMVASYNLPWFVVWLVALPIVCAAAVAPFLIVVGSKQTAPTLHARALLVYARVRTYALRFRPVFLYGTGAAGAGLLLYAAVATTLLPGGI